MTKEEKKLLLKDICARLPYDLCVNYVKGGMSFCRGFDSLLYQEALLSIESPCFKPYLRPMSSMTEEEKETFQMFFNEDGLLDTSIDTYVDWLLEGHFDFRGLIPKGLALEAPEDMYNTKTE